MIYNRNNLSIHALCEKNGRPTTDGIHFTEDYTEVTNGHYLMQVDLPEVDLNDLPELPNHPTKKFPNSFHKKNGCDFLIHKSGAQEVEKSIPTRCRIPTLAHAWLGAATGKENVEFITTDLEISSSKIIRKVDERYFATEKIFPDEEKVESLLFDPSYMLQLCQQFKKMGITSVKMETRGPKTAITLSGACMDTGQKVRALLMPRQG